MSKVRCAVVGAGGIGAKHIGWIDGTGTMETVAVCDPNREALTKVAEKYPNLKQFTDLGEMLAAEKLDFVVIASPHHLHAPLTIQALSGGVDVMVEKPMATRYDDCVAMIDAAKRHGRTLTVFHNRRLDSWYVAAKSVVDSGKLGPLVELRSMFLNAPAWSAGRSWRAFKETSGGLMYDWGAHLIDYVVNLAGSPVASVAGRFYRKPEDDPALNEAHGEIDIRFAGAAVGKIVISRVDREPKYRYTLIGENATLVDGWNWGGGTAKVYTGEGRDPYSVEEVRYPTEETSFTDYYADLASHYTKGTPLLVSAESAALVVRILNAADDSHARGGQPIRFD